MSDNTNEITKEQIEFEKFVRSQGGSVMKREGRYIESMTRLWRQCWYARASLDAQPQQLPESVIRAALVECLAWGRVYADAIPAGEWDEMRDSYADDLLKRISASQEKP